jgi:hypothetical protein
MEETKSPEMEWESRMSVQATTEHPAVHQLASQISHLLAEAGSLIPGPASELIYDLREVPASEPGTRRLAVTANGPDGPVDVEITMQFTVTGPVD